MLRFAVALSVVNNAFANVRANAIAVKAGVRSILHHLRGSLEMLFGKPCDTTCKEPTWFDTWRSAFGIPKMMPAFATALARRSYQRYRRQRS